MTFAVDWVLDNNSLSIYLSVIVPFDWALKNQ